VTADLDVHLPAIAAGDADAFGRWLAGAERSLREGLRPLAARVDVEAVLQEALLRVWQVAPRVQPDGRPNALVRFAARVARNLALDELRRRREQPAELPDLPADLHEADPLLRQIIVDCREKLPKQPAAALLQRLAAAGGEHDATLAERLGMRLNTFLQNVTRARKLLADCLRKRGVTLP